MRRPASAQRIPQGPVVGCREALEIAAFILGSDKPRGSSLEMICADFLVGAALENGRIRAQSRMLSSSFSAAASKQPASIDTT